MTLILQVLKCNFKPQWTDSLVGFFVMRHRMIITCLWDNLTPHFLVQKKISKKSLVVHWCWVAPGFVLHNSQKRGNFHRKKLQKTKTIFRVDYFWIVSKSILQSRASNHMSPLKQFFPVTFVNFGLYRETRAYILDLASMNFSF